MKIMYLIDIGFDLPTGSNHLILTLIEALLEDNNDVYLVESHSRGDYPDVPESLVSNSHFTYDVIQKHNIKKDRLVSRYINGVLYEIKAHKVWKNKVKEMDVVIVQSHYTAPFSFLFLRKYKKKTLFNIFDIFPRAGAFNSGCKKVIYRVFYWLQNVVYNDANQIITLTNDTKSTLIQRGVDSSKITVVPNWFDDNYVAESPAEENLFYINNHMSSDVFYVQYAGTIGNTYDFGLLVDVADKLKKYKNIRFQIVGEGINLDFMKEKAEMYGLDNIDFLPWQPFEQMSDLYSACSVEIIPLLESVVYHSFPSKILPVMACRRIPIISVEEGSDFYKEINDNNIGVAVPLHDASAMADAILELADDKEKLKFMEDNAKKYAFEKYAASSNTKKIINVLKNM